MFSIKSFDKLFAILILVLMSNGFISLLTSDSEDVLSVRESSILVNMLLICYAYYIFRSFSFYKHVLLYLSKSWLLIIFVIYLILNSVFSEYTSFSMQKVVALTLTIYTAICFCIIYDKNQFIENLAIALLSLLISSFLFGALLPDYGIHSDEFHENSWRGVFPQKQVLGQIALLSLLFAIVFKGKLKVNFFYIMLLFSIVLLFLCQSRTAWIVAVVCFLFYKYLSSSSIFHSEMRAAIVIGFMFLLISIFYHIYLNFVEVLDLLGKDATLTGRSTLWEYTLDVAEDNRWLGVGYKSFWQNQSDLIFIYFGYFAVNGHNFVLDGYLEIGLIGLVFIIFIFFVHFRKSLSSASQEMKLWAFMLLLYIALVGQVATIFPNQNSIVTFLFFVSYYGLIKDELKK